MGQTLTTTVQRSDLRPGDHIYVWRKAGIYSHHGIYVENGMVIDFQGTANVTKRVLSATADGGRRDCSRCRIHGRRTAHGVHKRCLDCFLPSPDRAIHRYRYGVSREELRSFRRGGTCCVASQAGSRQDVVDRAEYLLKHGFGDYSLFGNNCESFAVYCKTKRIYTRSAQIHGLRAGLVRFFSLDTVEVDWYHLNYEDDGDVVELKDLPSCQ